MRNLCLIPFESCVLAIISGKVWREGKLWMSSNIKKKFTFWSNCTQM